MNYPLVSLRIKNTTAVIKVAQRAINASAPRTATKIALFTLRLAIFRLSANISCGRIFSMNIKANGIKTRSSSQPNKGNVSGTISKGLRI